MKIFIALMLLAFSLSMCTNKKKEPEMIPVEQDNGIGDGAPSLDSLLQKSNDSLNK